MYTKTVQYTYPHVKIFLSATFGSKSCAKLPLRTKSPDSLLLRFLAKAKTHYVQTLSFVIVARGVARCILQVAFSGTKGKTRSPETDDWVSVERVMLGAQGRLSFSSVRTAMIPLRKFRAVLFWYMRWTISMMDLPMSRPAFSALGIRGSASLLTSSGAVGVQPGEVRVAEPLEQPVCTRLVVVLEPHKSVATLVIGALVTTCEAQEELRNESREDGQGRCLDCDRSEMDGDTDVFVELVDLGQGGLKLTDLVGALVGGAFRKCLDLLDDLPGIYQELSQPCAEVRLNTFSL